MMELTEPAVSSLAESILKHPCRGDVPYQLRQFKAHFGVSPFIVCCLWNRLIEERMLSTTTEQPASPRHLLWALLFLKLYTSEEVLSRICGTTAKTFRQRVWLMLIAISGLRNVVSLPSASVARSMPFDRCRRSCIDLIDRLLLLLVRTDRLEQPVPWIQRQHLSRLC